MAGAVASVRRSYRVIAQLPKVEKAEHHKGKF